MSKVNKSAVGARVMYCGHNGWFIADIIQVAGACVVRAAQPVDGGMLVRDRSDEATHHLADFPTAGYWNPQIGVFVVPSDQVTEYGVAAAKTKRGRSRP